MPFFSSTLQANLNFSPLRPKPNEKLLFLDHKESTMSFSCPLHFKSIRFNEVPKSCPLTGVRPLHSSSQRRFQLHIVAGEARSANRTKWSTSDLNTVSNAEPIQLIATQQSAHDVVRGSVDGGMHVQHILSYSAPLELSYFKL